MCFGHVTGPHLSLNFWFCSHILKLKHHISNIGYRLLIKVSSTDIRYFQICRYPISDICKCAISIRYDIRYLKKMPIFTDIRYIGKPICHLWFSNLRFPVYNEQWTKGLNINALHSNLPYVHFLVTTHFFIEKCEIKHLPSGC